jgi:hypothetical protein
MLRGLQNLFLPRLRDSMAARTANLVLTLRNALIVLLLRRTAENIVIGVDTELLKTDGRIGEIRGFGRFTAALNELTT